MNCKLSLALPVLAALLASPVVAQEDPKPYEDLEAARKLMAERKYRQAERILVQLSLEIPKSYSMWYQLALTRQQQGKAKQAIEPIEKALEINSKHLDGLLLGIQLTTETKPKKAKGYCKKAAALVDAKDLRMVRKAIDVFVRANAFDAAKPLLDAAIKKDPKNVDLLDQFAKLALGMGKMKDAAAAYRQILKIRAKDPMVIESLANLLVAMGKKRDAVEAFEKTLKIRPSNVEARQRLVKLMEELYGDPAKIAAHKKYIEYYKWVHQRARQRGATPPRRK